MVTELRQIGRDPTSEERKNYKHLFEKEESAQQKVRKKINKQLQEHTKKHEPYCHTCAKQEFKDLLDQEVRNIQRMGKNPTYNQTEQIVFDLSNRFDLKKYGPKYFELVKQVAINEEKLLDGLRTEVLTSYWWEYKCKKLGHKNSVQVPIKIHELRIKKPK